MVKTFKRLLISGSAREGRLGPELVSRFERCGLEVLSVDSDHDVERHPLRPRGTTLAARARPAKGWISVPEHGSLFNRPYEFYLHPVIGCRASCDFCFLNAKDHGRVPLTVHTDMADLEDQVRWTTSAFPVGRVALFSTGELADSLNDSDWYPVAPSIVEFFASQKLARLELRTKSASVDSLLSTPHNGCTTVAFSLSPQSHIDQYEVGTAAASDRLKAAVRCSRAGYPIAFKFEPLLLKEEWEASYDALFNEILSTVGAEVIEHFSIGCLRWSDTLAQVAQFNRAFQTEISSGEAVPYKEHRSNYTLPETVRLRAYLTIKQMLEKRFPKVYVYWSLETKRIVELVG